MKELECTILGALKDGTMKGYVYNFGISKFENPIPMGVSTMEEKVRLN